MSNKIREIRIAIGLDFLDMLRPYQYRLTDSPLGHLHGFLSIKDLSDREISQAFKILNSKANPPESMKLRLDNSKSSFGVFHYRNRGKPMDREVLTARKTFKMDLYKDSIRPLVFSMFEELGFRTNNILGNEDRLVFNHVSGLRNFVWYSSDPFKLWRPHGGYLSILKTFKRRHNIKDFIIREPIGNLINSTIVPISRNEVSFSDFEDQDLHKITETPSYRKWKESKDGVYCIKSAMGTGKTELIRSAMKAFKRVLIVTPRVSLASQLSQQLDIPLYSDIDALDSDKLVIQYDSLYKIDASDYDCCIFDEFMTLESHMIHNAQPGKSVSNLAKFTALLNHAVLILDALLFPTVLDYFESFRDRNIQFITNTFRDPTTVRSHKTLGSMLKEMATTRGNRITVSCVSTDKLIAMRDFLNGSGHKAEAVSSLDPANVRRRILEKFELGEITALVYTPSLAVGVSIEANADRHFHYDPGKTISPILSIQMMRRSRDSNHIDCFIQGTQSRESLSLDEIRESMKQVDRPSALVGYDKWGDLSLTEPGKIWSICQLHNNQASRDTKEAFEYMISENFTTITSVAVFGSEKYDGFNMKSKEYENCSGWTLELRYHIFEILKSRHTGYLIELVEDTLEVSEVPGFLSYYKYRRMMEEVQYLEHWRKVSQLEADFDFDYRFDRFCEVSKAVQSSWFGLSQGINQRRFQSLGLSREEFEDFGLVKSGIMVRDYRFNQKFVDLYDKIESTKPKLGDK